MTIDDIGGNSAPEYNAQIFEFISDDIHTNLREFIFSN